MPQGLKAPRALALALVLTLAAFLARHRGGQAVERADRHRQ
jgi:hypothetical protein